MESTNYKERGGIREPVIARAVQGMRPGEIRLAGEQAKLPDEITRTLVRQTRAIRREEREGGGVGGVLGAGASAFNFTLRQASRPVQSVESGLAELSRQGETNPVDVGPISLRFLPTDLGKVGTAAKEGFQLERHDTPVSIATEAGKTRAKQGKSTKSFGFLPGTNLKKGEALPGGTAGKFVYDIGGAATLDPLTYLSFGVSAVAKQGLTQTGRVLGAERAAEVAAQGTKILSAEEKTRLGSDTLRRLRGVRGGVTARVPQPREALRGGRMLSPPKTVIPGKYLGADVLKGVTRRVGASKAGSFVGDLFIPRNALIQAEREGRVPLGTAQRVETLQAGARGAATAGHTANVARLKMIAKDAKLSGDEALEVAVALDTGVPEFLNPRLRGVFDQIDEYRTGMSARVREAGLIPEEGKVGVRGEPLGIPDPQHYPHVPRISGKSRATGVAAGNVDEVRKTGFGGGKFTPSEGAGTPDFARRRTGGALESELAAGRDLETNPFAAYASRSLEQERALAARTFTDGALGLTDTEGVALLASADDFAGRLGASADELTPAFLAEHGVEKIDMGNLGSYVVDKAIAPEFHKLVALQSPDAANVLLRGLDKWMTLWKGYATVPLPFGFGFHMRNAMGNVMLNWLGDISPTDSAYAQAWTLQRRVAKGTKEGDPLKYLAGETRQIAQEALRRDVIGGGGFFIEDIPVDRLRAFRSGGKQVREAVNPLDQNNLLIRSGRAFGKGVEENARLAHFISKYREFGNFDDAATSMRRYLFDYADLTRFEQKGMKRMIPFYTFARKNTPLWVGAAFKQPGKYSRIQEIRSAFFDAAGRPPGEVTPQYVEEAGGVPLPFQVDGQTTMYAPDLPPTAASEQITAPLQILKGLTKGKVGLPGGAETGITSSLNQFGGGAPGFVKSLVEAYAADKNFFSGRQFYPGEQQALPSYLQYAKKLFPQKVVDGKKQPAIDAKTLYIMENLLPLLPKIESSGLLYRAPGVTRGGGVDKEREIRRLASMFSGQQIYPLGPNTQRSEEFRRAAELLQKLAGLRSSGKKVPERAPTQKSGGGSVQWGG